MSNLGCQFAGQFFNQFRSKGHDFSEDFETFTSAIRRNTLFSAITIPEANCRSWSDLPSDILSLILSFLLGRDRRYFHRVCRSWRTVSLIVPHSPISLSAMYQSPLLMSIGCDGSTCTFYHPLLTTTYIMDVPELADSQIRYSKDGWLLMSQGKRSLFFFNPFTKQRIDLPKLDDDYSYKGISFSSLPTKSDCIVFAVRYVCFTVIKFDFIRHGEDGWNICRAELDVGFDAPDYNPVFHNGIFYWMGHFGSLVTFDPKEGSERGWKILPSPKSLCHVTPRKDYLVECNGKLISVFVGLLGKPLTIYELDESLMTWRSVKSLGEKQIFLSSTTSLSATSAKQGFGMENKVYFPRFHGENCVFYSLFTRWFHTFETGYNRHSFLKTTLEKLHCTWIQPNFVIHSHEELQWNVNEDLIIELVQG